MPTWKEAYDQANELIDTLNSKGVALGAHIAGDYQEALIHYTHQYHTDPNDPITPQAKKQSFAHGQHKVSVSDVGNAAIDAILRELRTHGLEKDKELQNLLDKVVR